MDPPEVRRLRDKMCCGAERKQGCDHGCAACQRGLRRIAQGAKLLIIQCLRNRFDTPCPKRPGDIDSQVPTAQVDHRSADLAPIQLRKQVVRRGADLPDLPTAGRCRFCRGLSDAEGRSALPLRCKSDRLRRGKDHPQASANRGTSPVGTMSSNGETISVARAVTSGVKPSKTPGTCPRAWSTAELACSCAIPALFED